MEANVSDYGFVNYRQSIEEGLVQKELKAERREACSSVFFDSTHPTYYETICVLTKVAKFFIVN